MEKGIERKKLVVVVRVKGAEFLTEVLGNLKVVVAAVERKMTPLLRREKLRGEVDG